MDESENYLTPVTFPQKYSLRKIFTRKEVKTKTILPQEREIIKKNATSNTTEENRIMQLQNKENRTKQNKECTR